MTKSINAIRRSPVRGYRRLRALLILVMMVFSLTACTFNETTMDAATSRYFIDFGTANASTGTITISDCIFGQTVDRANGVRPGSMTLSVSGSYYTSDFYDVAGPIKNLMTAYSGASTSLWTDPVGGILTFLDLNFAGIATAGAPRWKH